MVGLQVRQTAGRSGTAVADGNFGFGSARTSVLFVTTVPAVTNAPAVVTSLSPSTQASVNESGLSVGWIVAIVAMILLAISVGCYYYKWYARHKSSASTDMRRPQSQYVELTRQGPTKYGREPVPPAPAYYGRR